MLSELTEDRKETLDSPGCNQRGKQRRRRLPGVTDRKAHGDELAGRLMDRDCRQTLTGIFPTERQGTLKD